MKTDKQLSKTEQEMLERTRTLTESIPVTAPLEAEVGWYILDAAAAISAQLSLLIELLIRQER